jgi:chromosomal replication initiator protein
MPEKKLDATWSLILAKLQESLAEGICAKWIKPLKPIAIDDDILVLAAPNELFQQWVNERYKPIISDAVLDTTGKKIAINIDVRQDLFKPAPKVNDAETDTTSAMQKALLADDKPVPKKSEEKKHELPEPISPGDNSTLNPKYTFDTFVTGKSNQFAHAVAMAVAASPGGKNNPFFMYGGVGLGKTHLMHAIGNQILANNPTMRVLYVSSEKFTNELINSIRDNHPETFRQKYRNIDVLMVDDIQFISGKQSTQEEFFHTFNTLRDANKQIILSSDRPPKDVSDIEERLRSRFAGGIIGDIQAPDLETRIAILRKKSQLDNLEVPNEAIAYIATRIDSNIRELEGALTRVMVYSSLTKQAVTTDLVHEALKNVFDEDNKRAVTVELIQGVVADYYKITADDLKAKKRSNDIAYPRQVAMYLCRELTDTSLPQIAKLFNKKDHTTVIHAHKKIAQDKSKNVSLARELKEIQERLEKV